MELISRRHEFDLRTLLDKTHTPYTAVEYQAQTMIFSQGQASHGVMYIERGSVRLSMTTPSGKEAICGVLHAGSFIGESALRSDAARRQTAVAMTDATIIEVEGMPMWQLLHSQPLLLDHFIGHVLERHTHLEADLTDQIVHTSEQRLARALLTLSGCSSAEGSRGILPRISQEHLARMVGSTRSRVNAFMSKFKKLGMLELIGGVWHVHASLRRVALGCVDGVGGMCANDQHEQNSTA